MAQAGGKPLRVETRQTGGPERHKGGLFGENPPMQGDGIAHQAQSRFGHAIDESRQIQAAGDWKVVRQRLEVLRDLGLGYLTLGEATPGLSGGEAQRLKLASEMGKGQFDSVFVFDEPTIGLHPLDVKTLLQVFQALVDQGATVIVIEHDLDVIRNADYIIDMGPEGGEAGGRIVAVGTPEQVAENENSVTGKFIR